MQAVITDNAWNKLTENQQAAVMEAAADTQAFNADLSETAENKVLDELKSSGCNVVDVPDKTPGRRLALRSSARTPRIRLSCISSCWI